MVNGSLGCIGGTLHREPEPKGTGSGIAIIMRSPGAVHAGSAKLLRHMSEGRGKRPMTTDGSLGRVAEALEYGAFT